MLKYLISFYIIFLLINLDLFSYDKKIWDNWYFGRRAGLSFDTQNKMPVPLTDGQLNTLEGCASISDTNGILQFYTNGVFVYNKNHDIMINGVELKGHSSSTQSALIVKRPGNGNIYYIFTVDKGPYEGESTHEYCFSIVDMDEDNGLGAVVEKNVLLYEPVIEKLTAVQHANGEDFWIIARGMNNNKFIISRLTSSGISRTETFEIGPTYFPYPSSPEFSLGQLKANPKGDLLATVVYGANNVELYKFDNNLGTILDYIAIPVEEDVTALYGVEFSTNNKFLYTNNLYGRVYQYDVSILDSTKIYKSMKIVYDSLNYDFQELGQMQLAPNGRIYIALSYDSTLSVVDKPNVPAPYCNLKVKSQKLNGRMSLFGLPNNVITGTYYTLDIYGRDICLGDGDSLELFSIVYPEDSRYSYNWTGPNGFQSSIANPSIPNAGLFHSGKYVCKVFINGVLFKSDSTIVNVYRYPTAEIIGTTTICPPEVIKLSSKFNSPEYIYKWSNGSNESDILINSPGTYTLVITNPAGCTSDTARIEVKSADNLSIAFSDEKDLCLGESLELSLQKEIYDPIRDYKFLWSTGDTTISILVDKPGYYSVTVTRYGGCSGTDSVYINEISKPTIKLNYSDSISICQGESRFVEPENINPDWSYQWSDEFPELRREITFSGKYVMYVINQGHCIDSAWVYVEVNDRPKAEIKYTGSTSLCFGDSLTLVSEIIDDDYTYLWSDGSISPQITVGESGIYTLKIVNSAGCVDNAEIEVFVSPQINLSINADKLYLCISDSITLSANERYSSYKWSTGDTNDFVRIYKAGRYKLVVTNRYGCIDSAEVEINEINISSNIDKNHLTIDSICAGDVGFDEINILYNSNQTIEFGNFEYTGDSFSYELEQTVENTSDGNYVHKITLTTGNNAPGVYKGEILITINKPCFNQFVIPVYVKVYSSFNFSAPEIIAKAGDKICINIDVIAECNNPSDVFYAPEFDVEMIPEHFYPISIVGGELINNIYTENLRTIKLKMDSQTFPKGQKRSIEICGTALVGKKSGSQIDISNINWNNDYISNQVIPGMLNIEGCVQDYRGLLQFKPISITVNPNPSSSFSEILINSEEIGKHFVGIYSIDGRLLSSYELNYFDKVNSQSINLNTGQLNQGIYQIIVRSPWNVLTEKLMIIKD